MALPSALLRMLKSRQSSERYACCRSDGVVYLVTVTPEQSIITGHAELLASDTEAGQLGYALEANLSDQQIAALAEVFDQWEPDVLVEVGDVRHFQGLLYEVIQGHTTQISWIPPDVPALWNKVTPPGVIPIWTQPLGAHDAWAEGAQVTHVGYLWTSDIPANVTEPGTTNGQFWTQGEAI